MNARGAGKPLRATHVRMLRPPFDKPGSRRRALVLFVGGVDDRSRYRVLEQVEAQERGAGVLREVELVDIPGGPGYVVAVRAMAGRRGRTDVAALACVVHQGQGAAREVAAVAGAGGQLRDIGRQG